MSLCLCCLSFTACLFRGDVARPRCCSVGQTHLPVILGCLVVPVCFRVLKMDHFVTRSFPGNFLACDHPFFCSDPLVWVMNTTYQSFLCTGERNTGCEQVLSHQDTMLETQDEAKKIHCRQIGCNFLQQGAA